MNNRMDNEIFKYIQKHKCYYSFMHTPEDEECGCFGILHYDRMCYFGLSNILANYDENHKKYELVHNLYRKIHGMTNYRPVDRWLPGNMVTYYWAYDSEDINKCKTVLDECAAEFITIEDMSRKNRISNDYLIHVKPLLFNCVERMLIASAENEFTDYLYGNHYCKFVIKWKPCIRCINTVKGKNVYYFYESYKKFCDDYKNDCVDWSIKKL